MLCLQNCVLCRLSGTSESEEISVVKADSEGWTVFLGRRIVLPFLGVSSPDCQNEQVVW